MAMAMINARFLIRIPQDISGKRERPKETNLLDLANNNSMAPRDNIHLESSETSESEEDKNQVSGHGVGLGPVECPVKHDGRLVMREEFPVSVDELFNLIFTEHPMMERVLREMKYTDDTLTQWEVDPVSGLKKRVCRLVVPITQPIGPKSSQLTDTQTLTCARPGELYIVDKECVNAGVPYCESFYVVVHFCIARVSETRSSITSYIQVAYRKSVWGLVKSFIEKNVWSGFEDYTVVLKKALQEECGSRETENGVEVETVEKERAAVAPAEVVAPLSPPVARVWGVGGGGGTNETALWLVLGALLVLLLLNGIMYYKLLTSQTADMPPSLPPMFQAHMFGEERSHEQWVSLVQEQAAHHHAETQRWRATLKTVVSLLKQAEETIAELQTDIRSSSQEGLVAALKPLSSSNNGGASRDEL